MPSTSTHQAKRPYAGSQPSITTYFPQTASSQPSYTISSAYEEADARSSSSRLPPTVQANLLSVGMRVRKSVPEGYKTGTYSAFTLFSDPTAPSTLHERGTEGAPSPPRTRPRAGARELTPFCGILKVGGFGQQPAGSGSYNAGDASEEGDVPGLDEVPFLSSQASTISTSSMASFAPAGNKRRFDWEGEGDGAKENEDNEERASHARDSMVGLALGDRPIAVPRRRTPYVKGVSVAQENVQLVMPGSDVDFEDADFLDYELVEVEMGGA